MDIFGPGPEYFWQEIDKISDISSEDTAEELVYNLPNITEDDYFTTCGWKIDWTPIYGKLEERRV